MNHSGISFIKKNLKHKSIHVSFSVAIDDNSTEGKIDSICIFILFVSVEYISLSLDVTCRFYLRNVAFSS